MKALELYKSIIEKNFSSFEGHGLNRTVDPLKNLISFVLRKLTSQSQRLVGLRLKYFKKIPYFSTFFSLDYLEYIIKNDPDIPYKYFPKGDKKEIDYFLTLMLKGSFSDGYNIDDFGKRWNHFEKIRKSVGKNLHYNLLKNEYTLYGFKSVVYPDTGIFPDNYKLNLISRKKHKVCFDIGAYIGDSAYIINKELKPNKIYAFEPELNNFNILSKNINLNSLNKIIHPVNKATSSVNGTMLIDNMNASSNIKKSGRGNKVEVVTIDNFVSDNRIKNVDLIKMDIEGAEMDTLLGAKNVIKKHKPDLVIAIYHRGQHFFEIPSVLKKLVPSYKFRFVALSGSSPVIERFLMASVKNI